MKVNAVVVMLNGVRTKSYVRDVDVDIDLICGMVSGMANFANEVVRAPLKAIIMPPKQIIVAHMMESPEVIVWAMIDEDANIEAAYKVLMNFALNYMNEHIDDLPTVEKIRAKGVEER